MKCLKQGLLFFLLMIIIFLPTISLADDTSSIVKKKVETVGRVTLESKAYPFDHYKLEANIGDGIMESGDRALHGINEGLWGLNKTITNFTLYSVDQLMSFDLISLIVDEAGIMSKRIYEIMSGTFLSLFIVIVGGTAAYRYFVNQQVGHAVKAIISALVIMALTFWFYSNAAGNIKWLNDRGAELEGIASSANVLLSSDEFNSNASYSSKEGLAVLENQLFNLMLKRPYLLLNYGSTKESDIVSNDPNRVDKLLEIKPYTDKGKELRKDIINQEVTELENKYMSADFSGERFGYLLVTLLSTIALSIPVLLLGIFKFLLQIWFLALVIFTAIPLVFSLIPSYSETALNHGKKLVGVLLMKGGLVLLIAVITGLVTLLYETVKVTNGIEGYAFVVFLIVITIWGLFKYRSEIFEVASAGMIQGQQTVERTTYQTFDKMGDLREKTIRMADKGYQRLKHQKASNQREAEVNQKPSATANGVGSQVKGQRSQYRQAITQNQAKGKEAMNQAIGKNTVPTGATSAVVRSASRNAGASIINLDDYKKGKSEGSTSQLEKRNAVLKPSMQQQERSPSRNPVNIDPNKPITKWEAQQQINHRRGDISGNSITSSKRNPKPVKEKSEEKTKN